MDCVINSKRVLSESDILPCIQCKESYSDYLEDNVFDLLLPALEDTLIDAHNQQALPVQKCKFNGLDNLAEILWNRNPRRDKSSPWLSVFDIPPFKSYLELHPRPVYPKSWLWSRDEAALRIQRYFRGFLVRKEDDVQEMRVFWKIIRQKDK